MEVLGHRAGKSSQERSSSPPQDMDPVAAAVVGGTSIGDLAQSRKKEDGVILADPEGNGKRDDWLLFEAVGSLPARLICV